MQVVDWLMAGALVCCLLWVGFTMVLFWKSFTSYQSTIVKLAEEIRLRAAIDRDPIAGRMQSQQPQQPTPESIFTKMMAHKAKQQQEQKRATADRAGTIPPKPRTFSRRLSPADQPIGVPDNGSNTGTPAAHGK